MQREFKFQLIVTTTYLFLLISLDKITTSVLTNMQHASNFQLIETTTYLFLSIYLNKVTKSVLKKTCKIHLSLWNLNLNTTKNLLSKFQNLHIFIDGLSIEPLIHPRFCFFIFFKLQLTNMYLQFTVIFIKKY